MNKKILLALAAILSTAGFSFSEIYKYTDETGKIVFSDKPPSSASVKYENHDLPKANSALENNIPPSIDRKIAFNEGIEFYVGWHLDANSITGTPRQVYEKYSPKDKMYLPSLIVLETWKFRVTNGEGVWAGKVICSSKGAKEVDVKKIKNESTLPYQINKAIGRYFCEK